MIHYSIATRTDPDLGNDAGLDKHTEVTELFSAKLQELCDSNCIYNSQHERAGELFERAAFDTALELAVEFVREETNPNEVTFTFNFVPTIQITEAAPTPPGLCADCPFETTTPSECEGCDLVPPVEIDDPDRYVEAEEEEAPCPCGCGQVLSPPLTSCECDNTHEQNDTVCRFC